MKKPLFKLPKLPKSSKFIGSVTDMSFWRVLAKMDLDINEKTMVEHQTTRDWILDLVNGVYYNEIHKYQENRIYLDEC